MSASLASRTKFLHLLSPKRLAQPPPPAPTLAVCLLRLVLIFCFAHTHTHAHAETHTETDRQTEARTLKCCAALHLRPAEEEAPRDWATVVDDLDDDDDDADDEDLSCLWLVPSGSGGHTVALF